ncbi:hypothetical protein HYH02_002374 [Chlamydomonas schloesseri]|uniref:Rubisco LSMT substrate-binding domain-containing protein n=1 Tax=Chlamydomonas schloesseri TaxID=2026947 RepID=A0A836BBN1_9CHLO|nr:hypothetical protein HYH02_002374 [Chlamydomonas schloesseri]|eukprot:KAG2453039.1 hypothetical protein HYH02_002374 [Chlamydomonas schloesseri]
MDLEERLERLDQISGRVGRLRSVYDRQSLLEQMGVLDPAMYQEEVKAPEAAEEEGDEPVWIPYNSDPATHNEVRAAEEPAPGGLGTRLVATADIGEDEAIIQVPLHNCLSLYLCEGLQTTDNLERQEAAADFQSMQAAFLNRWCEFHGPLPDALVEWLLDFGLQAPNARAKMAVWLLWVDACCDSPYWKQALAALPQEADMPNLEFAADEELAQLQWAPLAIPTAVRREALREFYAAFCASPLAGDLGFEVGTTDAAGALSAASGDEESGSGGSDSEQPTTSGRGGAASAGKGSSGRGKGRGTKARNTAEPTESAEGAAPKRPLPSFERFLWAYCQAESRAMAQGERIVFFPQASPALYTTDEQSINTTIAFVAHDGPVLDEWAVVAALRPVPKGAVLGASAPFLAGPARGGGGSSTQLLEQFGLLSPARTGGNAADVIDLQPDIGTLEDVVLKQAFGQEAATRLDMVTDPRVRHILSLIKTGDAEKEQMPFVKDILPPLQVSRLWGPGLIAGVQRLRLVEVKSEVPAEELDEAQEVLYDDERVAEEVARIRAEAAAAAGDAPSHGPPPVEYDEFEAWRQDPTMTELREVPGDASLGKTAEGRAEWRRMLAAWHSIPRAPANTREHGRLMDLAVSGAPLHKVFSSPRDITRELAAADALLANIGQLLASFPTTADQDQQLLAAAGASSSGSSSPARGRGRGGRRTTAAASDSDSEGGAAAAAAGSGAVTTVRQQSIVSWRLEFKLVWAQMQGMVQEYRNALAMAEKAAEKEAGAVASA